MSKKPIVKILGATPNTGMADTNYVLYGVLAGNQVTANSGATTILGDLGSNLAVNGSGTVSVSGQTNTGSTINDPLTNAQGDYTSFSNMTPSTVISSADIGGSTFTPGTTQFNHASGITLGANSGNNTITLNGNGGYFFQVSNGGLTTQTALASVSFNMINGAKPSQIFWLINGSLTLGSTGSNITSFQGTVICQGNITLGTNCTNIGSLCAPTAGGNITLNNNNITSTAVQQPRDIISTGYINIESNLSDNEAITISASNVNGGIDIDAGIGGINVETTNSVSLNAAAVSNFTTSNGNLVLNALLGLTNIDAGSGINIGVGPTGSPINIGTATTSKSISIGNLVGSTNVNVYSGTGGINFNTGTGAISLNANSAASNFSVNAHGPGQDLTLALLGATGSRLVLVSQGTGNDSIFLNTSVGGLIASIIGAINLVSSSTSGAAINFDSSVNNGGISLLSGNQGVVINSVNGTIGIGNFDADTILLGTAGPNTITVGNVSSNTRVFNRFGTAGTTTHQEPEVVLSDANTTLTIDQLLIGLLTISPTLARTLTLPTAALAVAGISGVVVNDSIDFTIINLGPSPTVTIAVGTGGTLVGSSSDLSAVSSRFRMRFTNVSSGTESYTVYRIS